MRCCKCKNILWFIVSVMVTYWFYATFIKTTDCDLFRMAVESSSSSHSFPEAAVASAGRGRLAYQIYGVFDTKKNSEPISNRSNNNNNDDYNGQLLKRKQFYFNHNMPLIFIGGVKGAGLTLMRAILDAHPDIRCGEDTNLISSMIVKRQEWTASKVEKERLRHAGMSDSLIDFATRSFILELIVKQGRMANILCNKDPEIIMYTSYAKVLFPNAKFILVVRDGRANADTIFRNKLKIQSYEIKTYEEALRVWNKQMEKMLQSCRETDEKTCLPVFYEELVLFPERVMRKVVKFLNVTWSDNLLHHERFLDSITTSNSIVSEPLHDRDLFGWMENVPKDVKMDEAAPMIRKIGYDLENMPPNYKKLFQDIYDEHLPNSINNNPTSATTG